MADKDHKCDQVKANDTESQDEQNSCSQNGSSGSCSSCSVDQKNEGYIGSPDDAKEVNKGAPPDLTEDVQKSFTETPTFEDCARCTEREEAKKLSDDLKELKIADESEDVQRPSLGKEEFNDGSDREKTGKNAVDQATENQQGNGSMDIGADENRQKVPGEESKEKNVSDTWTPPDCHISTESKLNESQAAGACCQGNSVKDKESDGENEKNSQSKENDVDSKSENVEEDKEVHDGYQLKPKQGNQNEHSGGGGGRHKKGKKNKKKTTWKKLDFQQEEKIPELKESQYTGPHGQRDSMQTKKHNDGENQKFQHRGGHRGSKHGSIGVGREENKHSSVPGNQRQHGGNRNEWRHNDGENQKFQHGGGHRDSKHESIGVGREENKDRSVPGNQTQHGGNRNEWWHNDGENQKFQHRGGHRDSKHESIGVGREENKDSSVPGNQRQHGGNRNEWSSPHSKNFMEGKEHHDKGTQRNFHSRESGKDSGNHAANAEWIEMSEHRGNPDNQRPYGSSERHFMEARNSTENEGYSDEKNQWGVNHRESDRDRNPSDEGEWKKVHTSKQRQKPGIQRQYGGNGDDRPSSKSRKNKRKENERNSDFKGEKYSENESSWERKNQNGEGERRHPSYPDEREKYEYFWKSHSVFSQWYMSDFVVDEIKFNCAEKYMMYQKAVLMKDYEIAEDILYLDDPRDMKQQGRYVKNFDQKLWDENCTDIVEAGNFAKFSQNEKLKKKLLNTYPRTLVEASPLDKIWGIGLTADDRRAWNQKTWKGKNLLGEVLTRVRDKLMGSFLDPVKPEETKTGAGNRGGDNHT